MQDLDPSDICKIFFLNPLKRIRVIIRTPTHGRTDGRTDEQGESSIPPLNFVSGGINMIKKTSFKLRPSNQHLELVNPRVADLTDVCHRAWTSLHSTLIMTCDLDDNFGSWAQFQKLIHTTSFRINQIINTWIFKIQQLLALKRRLIELRQP